MYACAFTIEFSVCLSVSAAWMLCWCCIVFASRQWSTSHSGYLFCFLSPLNNCIQHRRPHTHFKMKAQLEISIDLISNHLPCQKSNHWNSSNMFRIDCLHIFHWYDHFFRCFLLDEVCTFEWWKFELCIDSFGFGCVDSTFGTCFSKALNCFVQTNVHI